MKKLNIITVALGMSALLATSCSCDRKSEGSKKASLLITKTVQADAETDALKDRAYDEDAADDPAIWVHPHNREKSRIIGTDKKGGLAVYDLNGKELFYYEDGLMNNVDIRQNVPFGGDTIDIAACSNRTTNTIDLYRIAMDGSLTSLGDPIAVKMEDEVYGFCLSQDLEKDKLYAIINSKTGKVEQWEVISENSSLKGRYVRTLSLASKTEGMVSDDQAGLLFIGEEAMGIWKIAIDPSQSDSLQLLADSEIQGNENIYEDIEGLCIYFMDNGEGYLIASSQGNYSYAVFERKAPHKYLGSFRINDGTIDGVEETDGLDVINLNMGDQYPNGFLIVQDGYNKENGESVAQNFKMVRWEKIAGLFEPHLAVDNDRAMMGRIANK